MTHRQMLVYFQFQFFLMNSLYMKHRLLLSNGTSEWHMHQMLNTTPVFEPDVLKNGWNEG